MDFPFILIELFVLGVTAETLPANIKYEQSHGLFATAKCLTLVRKLADVTTHFEFRLTVVTSFCSGLSLSEVRFYTEYGRFALESPLWGA